MRYAFLCTSALALAFVAGIGLAAAQQQPPAADAQQQSQQEKAQQTPSGQMGKEEPSSHAPSDRCLTGRSDYQEDAGETGKAAVEVRRAVAVIGSPIDGVT